MTGGKYDKKEGEMYLVAAQFYGDSVKGCLLKVPTEEKMTKINLPKAPMTYS